MDSREKKWDGKWHDRTLHIYDNNELVLTITTDIRPGTKGTRYDAKFRGRWRAAKKVEPRTYRVDFET